MAAGRNNSRNESCNSPFNVMRLLILALVSILSLPSRAADTWESALSPMPMPANVSRLERTNCVVTMLNAFRSNDVVKALIFMPGATDELYMFHRVNAVLTNNSPSLLDAVTALTNQTLIRATFRPPFLLLHSDEDALDPITRINDEPTAAKLRKARFAPHFISNDRDWDSLLFPLERTYGVWFSPRAHTQDSWHFYRHSFAAWNLSGWEALQTICLAGKSRFTVEHRKVVFEADERVLALPKLDSFPK
jgi:hypothetical protein